MIACPGCGGNLKFDIASQLMKCDFCSNQYNPYDFDSKNQDAVDGTDAYDVHVFTCPQCGGELYTTDEQTAAFCSFCGSSTILYSRMEKGDRPKFIIPFKKTKQECADAFRSRASKALFLPGELKKKQTIESFRGVYVPYWSFDVSQQGPVSLAGERSYRRGDYVYTDHFTLAGDVDAFYNGVTFDASSALYDDISKRLEPFDVREKKPFTAAYLSGFYADRGDVSASVYTDDAIAFANESSFDRAKREPAFSGVSVKKPAKNSSCFHSTVRAADNSMMPVWFMSYRNKNRVAYLTVNGQTGKVVADFPISPLKYLIAVLCIFVPLFLLFNFAFTFTPQTAMMWSGAAAIVTRIIYWTERNAISNRETLKDDRGFQNAKDENGNLKNQKKAKKETPPEAMANKPITICFWVSVVLAALVFIGEMVEDIWFYGAAITFGIISALTFIDIIKKLEILTTHKLPQFDKKGGDDRAV